MVVFYYIIEYMQQLICHGQSHLPDMSIYLFDLIYVLLFPIFIKIKTD